MASGVTLHEDCLEAYQRLWIKSKPVKEGKEPLKYIIFNLNKENTEIVVEKAVIEEKKPEEQFYEEFVEALPENECRWAVYDLVFEKEGGTRKKIVLIAWVPDTASIKQKMVFAASLVTLRQKLEGHAVEIQASDLSEIAHEIVIEKAKSR